MSNSRIISPRDLSNQVGAWANESDATAVFFLNDGQVTTVGVTKSNSRKNTIAFQQELSKGSMPFGVGHHGYLIDGRPKVDRIYTMKWTEGQDLKPELEVAFTQFIVDFKDHKVCVPATRSEKETRMFAAREAAEAYGEPKNAPLEVQMEALEAADDLFREFGPGFIKPLNP